ncbi:Hypothetical protein R9X50_00802500 [Acrodontium crateriforme]|uniref:Uncharacterized protein n=1 Tax=Acrodontium crateriforme TaxID=150365 RepID=A0AAQ3MCW8_9PEZI|nr:Hypothetical protein R9X50_00802500 [Acrodontium crateriforme]
MATATAEQYAGVPRSSPLAVARSPDTASPIYPERAIRPLPKSRLKSKLSPEQVTTIVYPPDPPPISPTLQFSTVSEHVSSKQHARLSTGSGHVSHHHHHSSHVPLHDRCTCGDDVDSGDDEVEFDHPDYRYAMPVSTAVNGSKPIDSVQRRLLEVSRQPNKPPGPGSTASSADGYESFENTSNKKKRKIPLSGTSSMHQSQLSAEMASMGINQNEEVLDDSGTMTQYYNSSPAAPAAGTGISGAGRGRYGRQSAKHERRPLGSSTMNTINGYNARLSRTGGDVKTNDAGIENAGGIISQAIKTAAEQAPLTPPKPGKDMNHSLLQAATSQNTTPKTQFTFACESESANKMADQQAAAVAAAYGSPSPAGALQSRGPNGPANARGMSTQGTQTTPQLRQGQANGQPRPPNLPATHPAGQQAGPAPPPKPKPRRRPSKEFALAARQRQLQQEYTNYHHRPAKDNMYICEFCEYEDIFGVPPAALIRRYEIKDRQERKKAAEKRRLLEKAKMKNRKGKKGKGGKNNSNNAPAGQPLSVNGHTPYDPHYPPDAEGEEYYDDEEYGDEYEPVDGDGYPVDDGYYPPVPSRSGIHVPTPTPDSGGGGGAVGRPPPRLPHSAQAA